MTTNCQHAREIAADMYNKWRESVPGASADFDDLDIAIQAAWVDLAKNSLEIIGRHALSDMATYARLKISEADETWKKVLLYIVAALFGGAITFFMGGCTALTVTPEGTRAEGENGTLVVTPGFLSFSQEQAVDPAEGGSGESEEVIMDDQEVEEGK